MGGAQGGDQHPGGAGHADGGGHGQDHGLFHLLGRAALQGHGGGRHAGGAGAESLHVAAGGDLAHPEQAADLQHQGGDLRDGLGVHAHVHHGTDVAGVGAGVAGAGAGAHTDAVVADLGAHGVHQSLIQELVLEAGTGSLLAQLCGHVTQQEAGVALRHAHFHGLQVVLILVHDAVQQFLAIQAGADLVFSQDNIHHAGVEFLRQRDGLAHGQRHFALNGASQIRHPNTCLSLKFDYFTTRPVP